MSLILDHSMQLLTTGRSSTTASSLDSSMRVMFKLQSGVAARRLDSLKTAILMIEIIKEAGSRRVDQPTMFRLFDNFVSYIWEKFPEPLCMALVKYAIADRNITVKKLAECGSWSKISGVFKPVMLDNSQDPAERSKYSRFERYHAKLKACRHMSVTLQDFVAGEFPSLVL